MTRWWRPTYRRGVAIDPRTPVIIGVGQFLHRAQRPRRRDGAGRADGGGRRAPPPTPGSPPCRRPFDSIRVVSSLSWSTATRPGSSPQRLGQARRELAVHARPAATRPRRSSTRRPSTSSPALDLAVLAGGEAWRTRMPAPQAGRARLDWATSARDDQPPVDARRRAGDMTHPAEAERGVCCRCRSTRCSRRRSAPPPGAIPRSTSCRSASCGRGSARSRRRQPDAWIRDATSPPRRSARSRRATG